MSEKEQFLGVWEREFPTTLKVLKAFPTAQADFRPHQRSRSARELAWVFVNEEMVVDQLLKGDLQFPPNFPPAPAGWDELLTTFERSHHDLVGRVKKASEADLQKTTKFFTGPGKMVDIPKLQIMWFMVMDQVHHRGQFSVYLRMAGGKVPSIYGPSADEPWM